MGESILLPPVARGTLMPEAERLARLHEALPQTNWCGFYRRVGERMLAVGPYQGSLGCLRIDFARGVCGACARSGEVQLVPDVHAFPGHIACDDRTRSELVVPVIDAGGRLQAVLDLDSPHLAGFGAGEAQRLLALVREVFAAPGLVW